MNWLAVSWSASWPTVDLASARRFIRLMALASIVVHLGCRHGLNRCSYCFRQLQQQPTTRREWIRRWHCPIDGQTLTDVIHGDTLADCTRRTTTNSSVSIQQTRCRHAVGARIKATNESCCRHEARAVSLDRQQLLLWQPSDSVSIMSFTFFLRTAR
jgi:hypothetical protein